MQRIALFPGSFDPLTRGHESVVLRALPLFDQLIVAIGVNGQKSSFFTLERRLMWLEKVFGSDPRIRITTYTGLTIDICRKEKVRYILRGLRTPADFEFEQGIAQMNRLMDPEIETVFLLCDPEYAPISSSIVREIIRNGGDAGRFVPEGVDL